MRYNLSKKRGNGVKKNICIVVLLLFVLGLGGYLCYDKLLKKENKNNDNLTEEKISIDDRYKNFIDNYKSYIAKEQNEVGECVKDETCAPDAYFLTKYFSCRTDDETEFSAASGSCNQFGSNYDVVLKNGKLTVNYKDEELKATFGKEYLIAKDVWNFEMIYIGNGGFRQLYFIKEDGTVGMADIELGAISKNIEITSVENMKNITNILEETTGGASGPIFIDIDGKIY